MVNNHFRRAVTSMLAVILLVTLAFAPALHASAEIEPTSAELKFSQDDVDFSMKAYLSDSMLALIGGVYAQGIRVLDGGLYLSEQEIVLESYSVFGKAYGLGIEGLADRLADSIFAPGSGSAFALDQETYDALLSGNAGVIIPSSTPAVDKEAAAEVGARYGELIGQFITDNAEIRKAPETITVGTQQIEVNSVTIAVSNEKLVEFADMLLDTIEKDEQMKALVIELYDTGAIDPVETGTGNGTRAMTGEEAAAIFWENLPQIRQEAADALTEGQYHFTVNVCTSKETESLIRAGVVFNSVNDSDELWFTMGESFAASEEIRLEVLEDGKLVGGVVLQKLEDSEDAYSIKITVTDDGEEIMAFAFRWDKAQSTYELSLVDGMDSTTATGKMQKDDDGYYLTVDTVDGQPFVGELSLKVSSSADASVQLPQYTDFLSISEEEMTQLAATLSQIFGE